MLEETVPNLLNFASTLSTNSSPLSRFCLLWICKATACKIISDRPQVRLWTCGKASWTGELSRWRGFTAGTSQIQIANYCWGRFSVAMKKSASFQNGWCRSLNANENYLRYRITEERAQENPFKMKGKISDTDSDTVWDTGKTVPCLSLDTYTSTTTLHQAMKCQIKISKRLFMSFHSSWNWGTKSCFGTE